MSKTLHLNLKKQWFDMILSGEKTEEYRSTSPYWASRLFKRTETYMTIDFWKGYLRHTKQDGDRYYIVYEFIDQDLIDYVVNRNGFNKFDTITFSNGYAKDRPQFEIELKSIEIREGKPKWGANLNTKYFVLKLGRIINGQN